VFSRFYTAISERMDGEGLAALRAELLAPLSGAVVEIGAGDGRNLARYPPGVTQVTAVAARARPGPPARLTRPSPLSRWAAGQLRGATRAA
jgi:hypothetical protein